jgi:hypothetical protein
MAINIPKVLCQATMEVLSASGTFPHKLAILHFEKLNNLRQNI